MGRMHLGGGRWHIPYVCGKRAPSRSFASGKMTDFTGRRDPKRINLEAPLHDIARRLIMIAGLVPSYYDEPAKVRQLLVDFGMERLFKAELDGHRSLDVGHLVRPVGTRVGPRDISLVVRR